MRLAPNQPPRFYRGGESIAGFRGLAPIGTHAPEDWVGSTTTLFGESTLGLSRLDDGELLRQAIATDPERWLGPRHARRFGAEPALLVKLLDAAERLPVHCHPCDDFARRHLDCPFGKTEAWVIVEVHSDDPAVHLGFRHDVDAETLSGWVARQQTARLLEALHRVPVAPGDAVLVPAGVPHAIGAGIFLIELQEPTDLSVLLEWDRFDLDPQKWHLGLRHDLALACVDRSGWGSDRLAALRRSPGAARRLGPGVETVLPPEADPFFRAQRLRPAPVAQLEAAFAIVVVLSGKGTLATAHGGELEVARGDTVLVPHSAGEATLRGAIEAIRCLSPAVEE